MNWENFQTWLKSQLIPNPPPNSILVVDNTPYHNTREIKELTSTTRRAEMPAITQLLRRELYKKRASRSFKNENICETI
jgi:hypothetical protein